MAGSKSGDFDGYRKWLGITNPNRPPTHYELLKIASDEMDEEVIQAAAEQRRHYVESQRGRGHDDDVDEILLRIDEAQITLLNHEMRQQYDRQLSFKEKQRKSREPRLSARGSRHRTRKGKVVGEEEGIVKTFAGIMVIVCVAFGTMALFSFQLPWANRAPQGNANANGPLPTIAANPLANGPVAQPAPATRPDANVPPKVDDRVGELLTFDRHTGGVWCCAFSPDGKLAVSGQGDIPGSSKPTEFPILIWEVETGREVQRLEGHTATVRTVAFARDGRHCASGSWDKTVRIWNAEQGQQVHVCEGHSGFVTGGIAFSPDGRLVFSGSVDKTARMWDTLTGKSLKVFATKGQVHCLALSPDGKRLLTGETFIDGTWGNNGMTLWDIESGERIRTFSKISYRPHTVCFTPDGQQILSASGQDWVMQLWDIASGSEIRSWEGHSCGMTPDGKSALANSKDKSLVLWNLQNGKERARWQSHDLVMCIAISNDGRRALSAGSDQKLKVWGLPTFSP